MAVAGLSKAPNLEQRLQELQRQLASEFSGRYTSHEVARIAEEARASLGDAKVKDFVPLFVARETRARLLARQSASS